MEALGTEHLGQGCLLSLSVTVSSRRQLRKHLRTVFSFKNQTCFISPKISLLGALFCSFYLWPWRGAALECRGNSV